MPIFVMPEETTKESGNTWGTASAWKGIEQVQKKMKRPQSNAFYDLPR